MDLEIIRGDFRRAMILETRDWHKNPIIQGARSLDGPRKSDPESGRGEWDEIFKRPRRPISFREYTKKKGKKKKKARENLVLLR